MNDAEMAQSVLSQILDLYVRPEIERRQAAGTLVPDFDLFAAQVVMNVGGNTEVRLNDEVRAVMKVKSRRAVNKGDAVNWDDIEEIHELRLTAQDPNAGHFTILRLGSSWCVAFDCRYNRARVGEVLRVSRQFLDSARDSLTKDRLHAFCDNLFSAVELTAKGMMMMLPDARVLTSRKHNYIRARFNRWGKLGNVSPEAVQLLNHLDALRPSARYLHGSIPLTSDDAQGMLVTAEQLWEQLKTLASSDEDLIPEAFSSGSAA